MEKINGIYLYGASGHAKVVHSIAFMNGFDIISFIDNNLGLKNFYGHDVLHDFKIVNNNSNSIFISIGNNLNRKTIASKLLANSPTLIHPSSFIDLNSTIQPGTVIMANVAINAVSVIGEHCIINTNASVDHDCVIADFVHISPNVALAGNVEVGEGTHIGIGACVIQGVKIGKWATIGAGAVIINDVPDYAVVVGNPGRIIKYNQNHEL